MIKRFFLYFAAFIFYIFEDLIWNKFVLVILNYVKKLELYKKYIEFLSTQNRYMILVNFIIIFAIGEGIGAYSLILIATLHVMLGIFLYALKNVIIVFAIAILNSQKETLYSFKWFAYTHSKIVNAIHLITESTIYLKMKDTLKVLKDLLKFKIIELKNKLKSFILNKFF